LMLLAKSPTRLPQVGQVARITKAPDGLDMRDAGQPSRYGTYDVQRRSGDDMLSQSSKPTSETARTGSDRNAAPTKLVMSDPVALALRAAAVTVSTSIINAFRHDRR
jgi:hypothetical protein